jgi:regulator of replication initiation timing
MEDSLRKELDYTIHQISELTHALMRENARLKVDIASLRSRLLMDTEEDIQKLSETRNPSVSDIMELRHPKQRKGWQPPEKEKEEGHFYWQGIPARARRVLKHYKIKGPAGLRNLTVRQIKKLDNAGNVTIETIRELGRKYGIELKDR